MARRSHQPPPAIDRRLRPCRQKIQQKSVQGYLVTNRMDQFYLTGFDGEDGAVLILPRQVCLLTDGRFAEDAARTAPWASALIRSGPLPEAVRRVVRRHRIERLGFQPESLSVSAHAALRRAVRPTKLVAIPHVMERLRRVKDEAEVAAICSAVRVAESAFRAVVRQIRPGMTEREVAARIEHEMHRRGATGASFPIVVAEGAHASHPHARPGNRRIRVGSAVLIDWGAEVNHYRSDLTRVIFIRRIPPRFRRLYENVLAAQTEAIGAIRPGVRMCDVDAKARNRLKKVGLAGRFSHGLGHGLGLDIHEPPRLARNVTDGLEAGMVVTVEPGVYVPGVGGVRIEDDVLVTRDGCRVLTRLSRDLDDMVV